jgi:hypothetical protein
VPVLQEGEDEFRLEFRVAENGGGVIVRASEEERREDHGKVVEGHLGLLDIVRSSEFLKKFHDVAHHHPFHCGSHLLQYLGYLARIFCAIYAFLSKNGVKVKAELISDGN